MPTTGTQFNMDFQVENAFSRVFHDLRSGLGKPNLKALAHSVVDAFAVCPQVEAASFAANPAVTALLDPGWNRHRFHLLVGGRAHTQVQWMPLQKQWPQPEENEQLEWGSANPPAESSLVAATHFQSSGKESGDWARFHIFAGKQSAIVITLVFNGCLASHPEWGQEVIQVRQGLQAVCDLWMEVTSLDVGLRQLTTEKQALTRLNRLQGRFVGMASHEFKTPLTSITAYADALLGQVDDRQLPHATEFLGVIRTEAGRLLRMVNRILDFSRMEYGVRLLGGTPHDLAPLVEETILTLRPAIATKQLKCVLECGEDVPRASVDADLIRQVLINLIGNAVKFTPEGGGIIVNLAEAESTVEVRIADTGPGIPQHDIHRIFREFYRSRETASHQEGTGLGLTIVRHIINLHGGHVEARQRLGGGSVFTFRVPKEVHRLGPLPAAYLQKVDEEDARRLIAMVLQLIAEMAGAKSIALLLRSVDEGLRPVAGLGLKEIESSAPLEIEHSECQRMLNSPSAHLAKDFPNLDWSWHSQDGPDGEATMLVTLETEEKVLGCLVVERPAKNRTFGAGELEQLEVLSRVAAYSLKVLESDAPEAAALSGSALVTKTIEAVRTLLQIRRVGVPTAAVDALHLLGSLAREMKLPESEIRDIQYAAALHDAGMARVEDEILLGETELSFDERDEVDRHVEQGVDLMSPLLPGPLVAQVIRHHHERFDGSGYPDGLKGTQIPMGARLLAVIDAWFSLTQGRPFRTGLPREEALQEIQDNADSQFDGDVVSAFERILQGINVRRTSPSNPDPLGSEFEEMT
jgi:signal transduction histidine kinase